jgi:prepilin-type N-terminal cleavage/methylation domain-containing protein
VARTSAPRRGLTLIELVVVLTILVALGAILVPVVGNALTRSHLATCLTNFPEVTKMLINAEATRGTFGDGWTNPVDENGDTVDSMPAGTISTDEIAALAELGMVNFTSLDTTTGDYNVTFNNGVAPGGGAALSDGDPVVVLSQTQAQELYLDAEAGDKYVFFAIDKSWSLLGDLTPEPPVHFGDTEGALPHQVYSRFGAIFQVGEDDGSGGTDALPVADFKRVTVHIGGAFETADNHSGVYWQEVHE